jgi:hypothetical protein
MSACRIHLRYYSNPIRFCVKTLSAHGSHFGWRSWSPDTILKVYYSRTMHAMFALKNNFPIGFYVKTMAADGGHFGPRSGLLNTILEVDHRWHVCYIGLLVSEEKILKRFFPIGSYVIKLCPLKAAFLDGGRGHRKQFWKFTP